MSIEDYERRIDEAMRRVMEMAIRDPDQWARLIREQITQLRAYQTAEERVQHLRPFFDEDLTMDRGL